MQIAATSPNKSFAVKKRGLARRARPDARDAGANRTSSHPNPNRIANGSLGFAQTRAEGIRFLRAYGSKDALLRSCYNQSGMATDLIGYGFLIGNPVQPAEAQQIYYRVTGETFDASLPPERIGGRLIPQDTVDFDNDQGGSRIRGKLKGLSLANSKLEASVDANGGVGYMEWTLVFRNESSDQREARAEVQLPPGGVVSRLTLWVNGEPREAAFAGRGKVTQRLSASCYSTTTRSCSRHDCRPRSHTGPMLSGSAERWRNEDPVRHHVASSFGRAEPRTTSAAVFCESKFPHC